MTDILLIAPLPVSFPNELLFVLTVANGNDVVLPLHVVGGAPRCSLFIDFDGTIDGREVGEAGWYRRSVQAGVKIHDGRELRGFQVQQRLKDVLLHHFKWGQ